MEPQIRAQICLNGHCICPEINNRPESSQSFCDLCGAMTIEYCPECNSPITGWNPFEGVFAVTKGIDYVPSYCQYCGQPYPWTKSALAATIELINEEASIDETEKSQLAECLPDLMVETPKTNLAISRTKRFLQSAGKFVGDGVRQFAIDFGCELVKKQLGL